jgi:hypothetical protein
MPPKVSPERAIDGEALPEKGAAMSNPVGRPPDLVRDAWMQRFGLTEREAKELSDPVMFQLAHCATDEARRIILGKTEKYQDGEGPLLTDALIVR